MSDDEELPFQVKLVGDGIAIEKRLDRDTARAVMTVIMGGFAAMAAPAAVGKPAARSHSAPPMSLREFLTDVQAHTKPDQIVAIGHYIIESEQQPNFSKEEIKARFAAAKEPMPANFPRDFNAAIKAGMLDEVHGERGRYYVTRTGQQAVAARFGRSRA